MKIYTRTGDDGTTGLFGTERVLKCDRRLDAYGTLDELNALLGIVRADGVSPRLDAVLERLQNQLFDLGAELATPDAEKKNMQLIDEKDVADWEATIDSFENDLPKLQTFILPGGSRAAAMLHLARCVCRRGEREIVGLSQEAEVRELALKFINRTSDLLFVLARAANAEAGGEDVPWQKNR